MKPTLEEMCTFLNRHILTTPKDEDVPMLEAILVRLTLEKGRRRKWNRKRKEGFGPPITTED